MQPFLLGLLTEFSRRELRKDAKLFGEILGLVRRQLGGRLAGQRPQAVGQ